MLTINFVKKGSQNKYLLECSDNEDLQTVITQFKLSLPDNINYTDLSVSSMNGVALKLQDTRDKWDTFMQLFNEALDYLDKNKIIETNLDRIFVYSQKLTARKANNRFHEINYTEYKLKSGYLYVLDKAIRPTDSNNKSKTKNDSQEQKATKTALDFSDFGQLQRYAVDLETKLQDEQEGIESYKHLAQKSLTENARLTAEIDAQHTNSLTEFLDKYYSDYLTTPSSRLSFIQNMIQYKNSDAIRKMTNNSDENLLKLVEAVVNFEN